MGTTNPLIDQGSLNRLRASVVINDFPSLNVTAPYLGEEGISITLDGDATAYLNTLTGAVTSPEPFQKVTVNIHLLKTQGLAGQYKAQQEALSLVGNIVVRPDSKALPAYDFNNCSIQGIRDLKLNGKDAGFMVRIGGIYIINQNLYDT